MVQSRRRHSDGIMLAMLLPKACKEGTTTTSTLKLWCSIRQYLVFTVEKILRNLLNFCVEHHLPCQQVLSLAVILCLLTKRLFCQRQRTCYSVIL